MAHINRLAAQLEYFYAGCHKHFRRIICYLKCLRYALSNG